MSKRKIAVFSKNKLKSDLLSGKVPLVSVPRNIRLQSTTYYIYAFRYYRYFKNIDSPYDILLGDINSLLLGIQRQELQELYDDYWSMELKESSHNTGGLILGVPGDGRNLTAHRRLIPYQQRQQPGLVQDIGDFMPGKDFKLGKDGKLVIGGYGEGHCIHYISLKSVSDYLTAEELVSALSALASSSVSKYEAAYARNMFSRAASKTFGSPLKYVSIVGDYLKCYEAYAK